MAGETFDLFPDSLFHWVSLSQILLHISLLWLMLVYLSHYYHLHQNKGGTLKQFRKTHQT